MARVKCMYECVDVWSNYKTSGNYQTKCHSPFKKHHTIYLKSRSTFFKYIHIYKRTIASIMKTYIQLKVETLMTETVTVWSLCYRNWLLLNINKNKYTNPTFCQIHPLSNNNLPWNRILTFILLYSHYTKQYSTLPWYTVTVLYNISKLLSYRTTWQCTIYRIYSKVYIY